MKNKNHHGKHRSMALAERHRTSLEKKLGMDVRISGRRNAKGHYSGRGHFFTFTAIPRAEKDFEDYSLAEFENYMEEYQGDLDYQEIETSGDYGEE